jgi:hypothetical protein
MRIGTNRTFLQKACLDIMLSFSFVCYALTFISWLKLVLLVALHLHIIGAFSAFALFVMIGYKLCTHLCTSWCICISCSYPSKVGEMPSLLK